jgi:nicotinamidase-related amidase
MAEPTKSAVLLIDMQRDFWAEGTVREFPNLPLNTARLLDGARAAGLEIIHLRVAFQPDRSDWPPLVWDHFGPLIGSPAVEPVDWARELDGEKVLAKHSFDGFATSSLEEYLRAKNIGTLYVGGMFTSVCVLLTCASAHQRGFRPYLVDECCGDDSLERHRWTKKIYDKLAFRIKTLAETLEAFQLGVKGAHS